MMLGDFLVYFLAVLFVAFVLLFFALVAKVIDSLEERLKDGEDGDNNDDIMSHLIYEPWMYDDDFWK